MGCRYIACQKDGVVTQIYQNVVCRTNMHERKKDKKMLDFHVPERKQNVFFK